MSHNPTEPAHEDGSHRVSPVRWLLILPFIAILWVPFYNGAAPALWSVPFFYWYQFLWVLVCGAIIGIVFVVEHRQA